eukprot:CAMPEP_0171198418 /NCGR_PEP_ID=MMETSP0790-20130122/22929_1 /TAXON_ID=2925 /ORGANISM="Alexandrium catenella, Strain OF101" /LENGTH=40 /DNA_ID= /DNA_START= /DNA_END= /DNA_ORIENTATION=
MTKSLTMLAGALGAAALACSAVSSLAFLAPAPSARIEAGA